MGQRKNDQTDDVPFMFNNIHNNNFLEMKS